jgi:hypothetical protein
MTLKRYNNERSSAGWYLDAADFIKVYDLSKAINVIAQKPLPKNRKCAMERLKVIKEIAEEIGINICEPRIDKLPNCKCCDHKLKNSSVRRCPDCNCTKIRDVCDPCAGECYNICDNCRKRIY